MTLGVSPAWGQSLAEIDSAVQDGIRKGIYPGAVVVIGRRDSVSCTPAAMGTSPGIRHVASARRPTPRYWDVASITKIVSTTAHPPCGWWTGASSTWRRPVRRYLPRFSGGLKNR